MSTYNGGSILMIFAVLVMEKLDSPIDKYHAATTLATMQLVGFVGSIFVWSLFGKRKPTFFSLIVSSLAFLVITICEYLRSSQEPQV